jgi:hypothetical protein
MPVMGLAQLTCFGVKSYACLVLERLKTSHLRSLQAGVFGLIYDNLCVGIVCGPLRCLFSFASTQHKDHEHCKKVPHCAVSLLKFARKYRTSYVQEHAESGGAIPLRA